MTLQFILTIPCIESGGKTYLIRGFSLRCDRYLIQMSWMLNGLQGIWQVSIEFFGLSPSPSSFLPGVFWNMVYSCLLYFFPSHITSPSCPFSLASDCTPFHVPHMLSFSPFRIICFSDFELQSKLTTVTFFFNYCTCPPLGPRICIVAYGLLTPCIRHLVSPLLTYDCVTPNPSSNLI